MPEPIIIKLDYSPRDERRAIQVKGAASRLGRAIASRSIDRPNIGKNRRKLGRGRIDIPTGGVRGSKKPTGNRLDLDNDGWSDEGTTNPVWVGLSSGRERPSIRLGGQKKRPTIKINNRASSDRENLRKKQKYGNKVGNDGVASRKNGPKWLSEFSNQQIADLLVPDSFETYALMLADSYGLDIPQIKQYISTRVDVAKPWLKLDYSEKSTKELKRLIKNSLDESPVFSWAVRNYGSPIYAVLTRESAKSYNDRPNAKPLYEKLKQLHPDAPGEPEFSASTHLDLDLVTLNPSTVLDKKSWQTKDPVSETFSASKIPSASETVIDRSIPGTLVHEWAHWYHSGILLSNIESSENRLRTPKSLINPKDSDFAQKVKIAMEYNTDDGNMNLHANKVPFQDSPQEPRTITSYGHVSRKEIFAEGVLAYMHPNEKMKSEAINQKLKTDIENILAGDDGVAVWKDSEAKIRKQNNILNSGRQKRKQTKLSSGSEKSEDNKPSYPRHPSFGPFLGDSENVFANVKNWEEFKEAYNNLEISYFDYETTGLVNDEFGQSSSNGMPTQFGVYKTKGGKEVSRLNIYMNPTEKLGEWSRNNLKNKDNEPLTDEWLSTQKSIADAHRELAEFAGPNAIFGVQNSVFDNTVLEDMLTSSDIDWRPAGWIDTKVIADLVIPKWSEDNQDAPWTIDRKTGKKIPSSSLKALTEFLGIDLGKKHHTADADAAATALLMSKIIDKAIEKKWSNDIFNKEWRDQKIANKLENYQQKIIDFEQEKNNWISKTSPKKSTVPKDMDNKEFGFGRLSSGTTSYKGRHESPDASSGAPLHNLANGAIYPEDIYGPNGANLYGGAFPDLAQKAVAIFRKLRNKPDSELTVYRAVPKGKDIKEGDWVTILPEYAKIHGDSWLKDDYEIATKKVKAKELFNEGNSLLEFGYHSKLSSGKNDGAPTYKGRVWKDRKNELDGPVYSFRSQAEQYPEDGPPGISYFKGVVDDSTWVDCLLFRDDSGKVIGILNYYPFALVDPDDPRIVEKRGNINIFIDPKHKNKGIATKLVDEAVSRYNVDLRRQRYSEEGANFINNYVRKLPENKNKTKLSSGAAEPIKDIWNGDRYIQFQTYKDMEIGFTGEARLRDVPSGKRFVEMKVIDSVDGRLNRVPKDEARTFTEKTISAAIDWLLDRQIQTEAISSVSRRFILTEEQFKEFLTADIKATKAKPDPNKKKYPSMKKGFRVDEKELASLSGDKPDNRILVQVPNRFWDDHLSRLDDDFDSPTVRGEFRTETRLNHFELKDLISDADYHIDTAGLPGEEFDSMGAEQLMDALIKQGIPIENGKLKLSSGKTNRTNRRADNSRLSSGSQPRMNLSDEEKREIIAIASQRTDDFSKSVVAQFRRNGKLSDRQWNALNKMTLGRSRLSSGRKILPEERKKQRELVNQSIKYLRNSDLQITEIDLKDKKTGKITKSPIFTFAGRPIVLVNVNGVRIPFYQSTGRGGKENVPTGEWYPIFGIGRTVLKYNAYHERVTHSGGWFNKGTEKQILGYYGIPELKWVAQFLNGLPDLTDSRMPSFYVIDEPWSEDEILNVYKRNGIQPKEFYQITLDGRKKDVRNLWRDVKYKMPEQFYEIINRDLTPAPRVQDADGQLNQKTVVARIQANRAKLGIDLVSVVVQKDKTKESGRKKNREVELTVQDKNGDVIQVSVDSIKERKFEDIFRQDLTVRMKKNSVEVGVLHARTDDTGSLGSLGKLTISEILVPEDYHRRGHGRLMLELAERYNIDFEKVHHSSKLSELGELFAAGTRLSSGKTNRANRRANNPRLSSGSIDATKLTKAEQKILKEVKETFTPDFAKVVHAVALDYDEPGSILDNMKPTNMRVTIKNARAVSSEIQRQAQESLKRAGFPEEFSVWRTAGSDGRPNTGVVSVTTRKGGLRSFRGTVVEYRVSRSDVLTHGEGFLGNLQTYAEDELHVDIKKLSPIGSKLSSGKSPVLNDEEKKQISDILKKEFPEGISNAVGKMADYSGSRLQNNRDGQVSLNPQEKKAIEALESIGRIIDKRISEAVSERESAGDSEESRQIRLLSEKEKTKHKTTNYFNAIQKSIEDKLKVVDKINKQMRKSIISNIYKIPKKTPDIDRQIWTKHNNKISGSYLVQLLKDVRKNLTAGEYLSINEFDDDFFDDQQIVNFSDSTPSLIRSYSDRLHLTDLVSEADMAFLELEENKPIIHDIMMTLNLADTILTSLIKKIQKEDRKISELSDAEVLDFVEQKIYYEVEVFGPATGSKKFRRNRLTGQAFTLGEDSRRLKPEFDEPPLVVMLNEKSAKDLLIKTIREVLIDGDVTQALNKSLKEREDAVIEVDEKLGEGVEPQYLLPQNLSLKELKALYDEKRFRFYEDAFELLKETQSQTERGFLPEMRLGAQDFLERQEAELKRELFVQALEELGVVFTKPENVRKTVVRLYKQRLDRFYQWVKGLGLREGRDGKNRPDETIDFSNDNPYEYRRQVGGEAEQRHATTYLLMNKVLSLIPENLTNGSLIVELPVEEAERLKNLSASETFGYLGKHKIISKYFADAWVNPLEKGGSKLSVIWRLVPGKERAHAHNILNGKVLITQEPAPTDGPTDAWESVALHEITHGVEYANPVVTALEWMYWASRRKANEALTTLRHRSGKEYRDKDEKGVVDEWGESYAGKIYGGRPFDALEILTTGMQSLFYENTSKNVDPSHRAFTIGILVAAGSGKPQ